MKEQYLVANITTAELVEFIKTHCDQCVEVGTEPHGINSTLYLTYDSDADILYCVDCYDKSQETTLESFAAERSSEKWYIWDNGIGNYEN